MSVHMQRQIDKVKQMILTLASEVERLVKMSIEAVDRRDADLAQQVIEHDTVIDLKEVDIEEECLHTLALEQPVALDLRYVVGMLKMNAELERIADMAVNIAEQARFLAEKPPIEVSQYIEDMPQLVLQMLSRSLQALLEIDPQDANEVRMSDDRVDALHRRMYDLVETAMRKNPDQIPQLIHLMVIARNLERIADQCTNIAEDVIYMAQGDIVRHRSIAPQ